MGGLLPRGFDSLRISNAKFITKGWLHNWRHFMLEVKFPSPSANSQPWRFTNNSLGLPLAHSLSVRLFLWVCVVCVCFLLYLSFYLCCVRCVFCVLFYIYRHLLLFIRMTLLICLSFFSICMSIILIPTYVYINNHTHFPPLPYWHTHPSPFSYVLFVLCPILIHMFFVWFLLCARLNRRLCYGVYWCNHTPTHILIIWFLLYFHFLIRTSTIVWTLSLPTLVLQTINFTMKYICE